MIRASLRMMALTLLRDRPMLALTFLLPPLVFLVFTTVFRDTSSHAPIVQVAILDKAGTEASRRLADLLAEDTGLRSAPAARDLADLKARVASGATDVGAVIRTSFGQARPDAGPSQGEPPFLVMSLPGRELAGDIAAAHIGRAAATVLGLPAEGGSGTVVREAVGSAGGDAVVAYHAGAIAVMFLMIAAVQVAATLVEEREAGIYERVASGGTVTHLVLGKFAFAVAQGTMQAFLILLAARLAFGLDVMATPLQLLVSCLLAAALAASLTLAVASCCSTRYQAQTLCTFGVLALSAIGGSMVPRLLMPPWMKSLGWATPNAWAIEAFQASFRVEPGTLADLAGLWAVIAILSGGLLGLAVLAFRREPAL